MKKFRELLFLNSINRVGKKTIYGKYWDILINSTDFDELVSKMSLIINDNKKIKDALTKSDKIYNQVIENSEIDVITIFDENYPEKLKAMGAEKPLMLYIKGNVDALTKSNIAVIGTRKPSDLSKEFEQNLVKNIVNSTDVVIVSGLALGCDKIAHKTTVDENDITIAILPSGLDVITPASNKKLADEILENGGCLVSEYNPNVKANKGSYLNRDKIVAAFSDAIFVVECSIDSGTMHTVNFASDYQRQIYAYLPDERPEESYGGNEFIIKNKDGIKVENIEEFLSDLETIQTVKKSRSVQQTLM